MNPDQVKIYEPILKDSQGKVTTGLPIPHCLYAEGGREALNRRYAQRKVHQKALGGIL